MLNTILFIDGENFRHKVEDVVKEEGIDKNTIDFASIDIQHLVKSVQKDFNIRTKLFYAARLKEYKETIKKSKELIAIQRRLKTNLEKQGFDFIIAGNVRAQVIDGRTPRTIFREKGVDVKIAVDLVSLACDRKMDTAIICSSDSDLQPAIAELKKRKIKVVYLGFQMNPNKGLTFTADETILFRNNEILQVCPKKQKSR